MRMQTVCPGNGCTLISGHLCDLFSSEVSLPMAMDILDMSVTTPKGNCYVVVMVDCFSRWIEACPLPNKAALAVDNAFFQLIVCRFGMPSVIHSDQGREFDNHLMQELCLLCGAHKT